MKKISALMVSLMMSMALAACSSTPAGSHTPAEQKAPAAAAVTEAEPEWITITTLNGDREKTEIEVPYNPARIAVMDLAILDILDNLGFGDRVVGVSKGSSVEYLQKYTDDDALLNLGTIKEINIEKVMECEPDIIFIGGRLAGSYNALSEIAPVVFLASDVEIGLVRSTGENALTVASIFGAEEKVSALLAGFDSRIEKLQTASGGKTAFVGMLSAGGFSVLGNDGRCSIIGVEAGFDNIGFGVESERTDGGGAAITSVHGNETSFEFIVRLNPDYIFVMNRDAAIGTEGALTAQEVIENDLIKTTAAYKNGNIVYLQHSDIWYTAEGGITALSYMLGDLEQALLE